jgi:serine protease
MTFDVSHFGLRGYEGTSMAAPHVSGVAALVIACARAAGQPLAAGAVESRIELTARDLGAEGYDARYGHGLLDAAAALR